MKIYKKQEELKGYLNGLEKPVKKGFVPTMGALHEGHLSLVKKAREECDIVICSIFVNPTQFNQVSDLENYPVTHQKDVALLTEVGCDVLFLPSSSGEVYKNEKEFQIDLSSLEPLMEGKHRPGHFDGVTRVVKLLLEIVSPDKAYFGLKDYQQFLVVSSLVKQLSIPTEIVGCDIVREKDGLAMSSRNVRLSEQQRKDALIIKETLDYCKENFDVLSLDVLKEKCLDLLSEKSVPEYFEICDSETLLPISSKTAKNIRVFTAALVGEVRLIDNLEICRIN